MTDHPIVPFALLVAGISLISSPVLADDELSEQQVEQETEQADMERAQEAFDEGARYYYDGDYSSAIVEFRRANQIHPHPIFQHNIARSHLELDRPDRALNAALEAEKRADELPPDAAATNSAIIAGYQAVSKSHDRIEEMGADVEDIDDPMAAAPASRWGGLGWAGAGALGAGLAALGGAAIFDRRVYSGKNELEEADDMPNDEFIEERDSLQRQQTTGLAMLWSGIALGAVGTSLIVWELATTPEIDGGEMAVSPSVDRPGVRVLMRW